MPLSSAAVLCMLALPVLAQSKPSPVKDSTPKAPAAVSALEPTPVSVPETPKAKVKPRVRLQTTFGPIVLELEPDLAPKTVENFLMYVKEGFYSGTIFHRVILDTVIQGGGLTEDLTPKPTHPPVFNEAHITSEAGLKNTTGSLAMARSDNPHSAAAQFFINVTDNPQFDPHGNTSENYGYCVFGRVVEGMETVMKIQKVQTIWRKGQPNVPEYAVRIKSAEQLPETEGDIKPVPPVTALPGNASGTEKPKS